MKLLMFIFLSALSASAQLVNGTLRTGTLRTAQTNAVSGAAAVWQYSGDVAALDQGPFGLGAPDGPAITVATNGTIDQLSAYILSCNGGTAKLALYDNAGSLLAFASGVIPNDGAERDFALSISGQSATTNDVFYVIFCTDTGANTSKYANSGGTRKYKSAMTFANEPTNPLAEDASDSLLIRAGIHITP